MEQEKTAENKKPRNGIEKKLLIGSIILSCFIFILSLFSPLSIIKGTKGGLGDVNYNINCSDPDNRNSAYCQEKRVSAEEDWKSVVIGGNKKSKFSLNYRKK